MHLVPYSAPVRLVFIEAISCSSQASLAGYCAMNNLLWAFTVILIYNDELKCRFISVCLNSITVLPYLVSTTLKFLFIYIHSKPTAITQGESLSFVDKSGAPIKKLK